MILRLILIAFMAWFIVGCGGKSGGEVNNTKASLSKDKVISGYVIDDPIVKATIAIYDLNGTLIKKEENATDSSGKFSIKITIK